MPTGGAADQSKEKTGDGLARMKLDSGIDFKLASFGLDRDVTLIANATGWYDIAHSATYHRLEAILRLSLSKDRFFDLTYENGSGAPNFNKGSQFSANLTVQF
jgi:hypothetical protein